MSTPAPRRAGATRSKGPGGRPSAAPAHSLSRGARASLRVSGLLPYRLLGIPLSRFVVERNILVWRTQVVALVAGLTEPLLYLLVMGVGVGGLVGDDPRVGGSYGEFVAAGLLGAAAMNAPVFETYNVFFKLRGQLYEAMGATPADPRDIAVGEVIWTVARVGLYALGFLAVAWVLGAVSSPTALLALPVCLLIGLTFAAITLAGVTFMRSWHDFDAIQVAVIPMFVFSATFYPIEILPRWAQVVTSVSPLYHGVVALRQVMTADVQLSILGHLAVLVVLAALGMTVSMRRFTRLLRS